MRRLALQSQVSLDAFMASEDGSTDWMVWSWGPDWTWDPDLQRYHSDLITSAQTVLLPGRTPAVFVEHRRAVEADEGGPMHAFAHHLGYGEKVVFSREHVDLLWDDTTAISGELTTAIHALKAGDGGDILAFGGASFAGALLAAGVVDELRLFVNPVAIGTGLGLFDQLSAPLPMELIEARRFQHGMQTARYRVSSI